MATRGQESPMDFQWDNTHGRIDPNSPFKSVLQTHTSCRKLAPMSLRRRPRGRPLTFLV